jgi:hypothetical protein
VASLRRPGGQIPAVLVRPESSGRANVRFDTSRQRITADGAIEFDGEALEQLFGLALRAQNRQAGLTG